ncbi:MAG: XRE family transcriptional regulator [Clostridiales bacterium]|nr:XRE family transcriptional regulator [Clostridiales bacterium]
MCGVRKVRVLQEQKAGAGGSPCQHRGAEGQGTRDLRHGSTAAAGSHEARTGTGGRLMAVNEVFCRRLRMLRERKHLKRRVLAELCGLSQHMIRRYEEGEMEPKSSSLEALSDYFGVTVDYLLGREEKNKKGT